MVKREREDDTHDHSRAPKRTRTSVTDRLSTLSDELILRVLSYLPVSQLVVCQRLSHKYQALAGDSQLWKAHYYNRFVRPRASRIPGVKDTDGTLDTLHFASRASRWLEDEHLVARDVKTNWKRQYKLRFNWTRGSCVANEIEVAQQAPVPPLLVQMHNGVIYIANQADGLRAWSSKGERKMVAQTAFSPASSSPPTSLAIDSQATESQKSRIIVGFEDGAFSIHTLDYTKARISHVYNHEPSSSGVISSTALSWPYAVTMTATQRLSLYRFSNDAEVATGAKLNSPHLLHSLKSHTVWPPLSTSLRTSSSGITISVAYALPTYLSGWTVGIQEIRVSPDGDFLHSRLASAIDQHYRPLALASPPMISHIAPPATGKATSSTSELRHIHSKPTSLSYTHPYLLVSHPDNTLTLYLVTSTEDRLSISAGSRLWGHTSSVSGAHVGRRGKAVSVSKRGDELRVWELEGGFASSAARKRLSSTDLSVQIRPDGPEPAPVPGPSQPGLELVNKAMLSRSMGGCAVEQRSEPSSELTLIRGWVGFDEENVVILKEKSQGRQALIVYDFT